MSKDNHDPRLKLLASIQSAFEGNPQAFISQTTNPSIANMTMIGSVIQMYCYADFNGRRIVDVLRHAALGEPRCASRLQDAQIFPMLIKLVHDHIPNGELQDGLLKASDTIELHRGHRHNFAHWMVRRVRDENALVMFSMNSKEAQRRDGLALNPKEAKYSILPLDGFDVEIEKLKVHTNYLANSAAYLERNVDELRNSLSSAKRQKGTMQFNDTSRYPK